jgi:hypothetical protein
VRGAREALEPLLNRPGGDFRLAWVFIDMMKTESERPLYSTTVNTSR